jgi:hypothetical protein
MRLVLNRMNSYVDANNISLPTQFEFKTKHSTIHQEQRVVDPISYENKQYCTASFIDILQTFD